MPDIIVQSSMLSSVLPKKNPTAHSNGLSIDTANASATTLFDCKTHLLQLFQHQMFPYLEGMGAGKIILVVSCEGGGGCKLAVFVVSVCHPDVVDCRPRRVLW